MAHLCLPRRDFVPGCACCKVDSLNLCAVVCLHRHQALHQRITQSTILATLEINLEVLGFRTGEITLDVYGQFELLKVNNALAMMGITVHAAWRPVRCNQVQAVRVL